MWRSSLPAAGLLLFLSGCRYDMQDQPRYEPLQASAFFPNHSSARHFPDGTVARGQLNQDILFYTGMDGKQPATVFPVPITSQVLARGRERYNIYCSPCHSEIGDGNGMIPQRGFTHPPSYHTQRLRDAPVGHFFDVITNGFGAMYSYAARVEPADRWAIIAYIRALQAARTGPPDPDVRGTAATAAAAQAGSVNPAASQGGQQPNAASTRPATGTQAPGRNQ